MNAACSFQSGCSRVLVDLSRFEPAEEITTNVLFIADKVNSERLVLKQVSCFN
jgi:hypothetical protein